MSPEVWNELVRLASLRDYNTRVVLLGTLLLGIGSAIVGVFMLLRKRALLGDVVSHSALPGIAVAFILFESLWPGTGKSVPLLLGGAAAGGFCGVLATTAIRRWTRIKDDAALAIVLSIFFGIGISLFTVIQRLPAGNSAGLSHFIYGQAASMTAGDVRSILVVATAVLVVCLLLFKEFATLCFDERFAASQGWPVLLLDQLLMGLVVTVSVIGLQSVGLLLVVALLIVPAAAARFWTERLGTMLWIAGLLGGMSSVCGVALSALVPRVATGATIVLIGAGFFLLSLLFGNARGILPKWLVHRRLQRRTAQQHVLRGLIDIGQQQGGEPPQDVTQQQLLAWRSWSPRTLQRAVRYCERQAWVERTGSQLRLTSGGRQEAQRIARNHRLWEQYLTHCTNLPPEIVDRQADRIEHVLDAELVRDLERGLNDVR